MNTILLPPNYSLKSNELLRQEATHKNSSDVFSFQASSSSSKSKRDLDGAKNHHRDHHKSSASSSSAAATSSASASSRPKSAAAASKYSPLGALATVASLQPAAAHAAALAAGASAAGRAGYPAPPAHHFTPHGKWTLSCGLVMLRCVREVYKVCKRVNEGQVEKKSRNLFHL